MYAIFEAGGVQHCVKPGDWIKVNDPNLQQGEVRFDRVKYFSDGENVAIGRPDLEGFAVVGQVAKVIKGPKLTMVKYRPRKHSQTKKGHRQKYSLVKISSISKP